MTASTPTANLSSMKHRPLWVPTVPPPQNSPETALPYPCRATINLFTSFGNTARRNDESPPAPKRDGRA